MHQLPNYLEIALSEARKAPAAYEGFIKFEGGPSDRLALLRSESQAELNAVVAEWQQVTKEYNNHWKQYPVRSSKDSDSSYDQKVDRFNARTDAITAKWNPLKPALRDARLREAAFRLAPDVLSGDADLAARAEEQLAVWTDLLK